MKKHILPILIILGIAFSSYSLLSKQQTTRFISEEYGFSISIPEGFRLITERPKNSNYKSKIFPFIFEGPREVKNTDGCWTDSFPAELRVSKSTIASDSNIYHQFSKDQIPRYYDLHGLYDSFENAQGYPQFIGPDTGAAPHCYKARYSSSVHLDDNEVWFITLNWDNTNKKDSEEILKSFRID